MLVWLNVIMLSNFIDFICCEGYELRSGCAAVFLEKNRLCRIMH